jgi:serine protease Do
MLHLRWIHRRTLPLVLGILAGLALGAAVLVFGGRWPRPSRGPSAADLRAARRNAIVLAVEAARPSVVTIRVQGRQRVARGEDELLWFPLAPSKSRDYERVGSGFFIDTKGYILTNEHVVRGAERIVVSIGDATHGMSVQARTVGTAPQFDLALLQVPPIEPLRVGDAFAAGTPAIVPLVPGDSDDLMVGEWVIAIGSPFGQELGSVEPSVSVGVVSAVERDLPSPMPGLGPSPYLKMIETDAAIHAGNSGGPLLDATGRVIGVNTVSFGTEGSGASGIHFAIPINTARWVWQELLDYGEVRKPWIGWSVADISPEVSQALQLPEDQGIVTVTEVVPTSPADRAGMRAGDVLLRLQGSEPYSRARAERILFGTPVDADVTVEFLRDGQMHRTVVHVIEDPYTRAERERRAEAPPG